MLPEWTTSCPDWERRIVAGESLIPFPPLYPEEAEKGLAVFKELRLKDIPGSPTYGEVGRKWQFDIVSHIFGSCDPETGRRKIREFFIMVSKKNDKSGFSAGVMITASILNWRPSAEFFIIAPSVKVAGNSFGPACGMINSDEELSALMHPQEHLRKISNIGQVPSSLTVVAAENDSVSGLKGTGILVEELWTFGKRAGATNMFKEATGGLAARPEGFVIWITTQSDEAPAGVFADKLEYARGVRDGKINDPAFLPIIYEFPQHMIEKKLHLVPANFYVTNPNLGASVDEEDILREFGKAEIEGIESMQGFLAKRLDIQIAVSARAQSWAGAEFWEQQGAEGGLSLDDLLSRCEVVVAGIDGGGLDDLLGLAILGREVETRKWLLWTHAWCHPCALERRKSEAGRYHDFERERSLTIVSAVGDDVKEVGDLIMKCENSGLLDRIGVDQAGIGDIVDELTGRGIEIDRIVGISQGWRLNAAIKTTERKLAAGELIHGDQSMMNWCAGNARVEPKGNAILITKQVSGSGKIDPLMAALNAVSLMALNPEAKGGPSVYETRGVLVF